MANFLNLDALAITAGILTLIICLGLIAYVIWGWHKRMRYHGRKLKQFTE